MPNTFTLIASSTVGSGGTTSITFSSIPQTYTDLQVLVSSRNQTTDSDIIITYNGSGGTYTAKRLYGTGSATGSDSNAQLPVRTSTSSDTASTFSNGSIYIPNYTGSNAKSFFGDSVQENNAASGIQMLTTGLWSGTAAITSIGFTINAVPQTFAQYTTIYLYGIKNS